MKAALRLLLSSGGNLLAFLLHEATGELRARPGCVEASLTILALKESPRAVAAAEGPTHRGEVDAHVG